MVKRSILFKLAALVVAMMCAHGASAVEFSMPDVTGQPGQEVTIPVSLQGDDVNAYQFRLTCPEAIEIVRAKKTDRTVEDATFYSQKSTEGGLNKIFCYIYNFNGEYNSVNLTGNSGPVANVTLRLPDDASGQYTITLTELVVVQVGLNATYLDDVTATLTVVEPQRGDVDCDGSVTISDVTALIDYLLSGYASGISLEAADCELDGSITINDVTTLIDYLLFGSWPGEKVFTVGGVTFKMIDVEGGTFTMGATPEQGDDAYDDESPTHQVTLSGYSIGETEVTQALWQVVMGSNPSNFTGNLQRPVETVSWNDCQTFITKLNELTGKQFRLPTEAEWEYAARGGNKSQGYKYAGSNTIGDVAWYSGNSSLITHVVATKAPNELGLYDMSGNVWEWCQDWYGDYSSESQTNPTGPASGSIRVFRGGSLDYFARYCRVSSRGGSGPAYTYRNQGLRLAL